MEDALEMLQDDLDCVIDNDLENSKEAEIELLNDEREEQPILDDEVGDDVDAEELDALVNGDLEIDSSDDDVDEDYDDKDFDIDDDLEDDEIIDAIDNEDDDDEEE